MSVAATNAWYVVIPFSKQCEGPSVPQSPVVVMIALETNRRADEFALIGPGAPRVPDRAGFLLCHTDPAVNCRFEGAMPEVPP
jgi:hypothetical protein